MRDLWELGEDWRVRARRREWRQQEQQWRVEATTKVKLTSRKMWHDHRTYLASRITCCRRDGPRDPGSGWVSGQTLTNTHHCDYWEWHYRAGKGTLFGSIHLEVPTKPDHLQLRQKVIFKNSGCMVSTTYYKDWRPFTSLLFPLSLA